MEMQDVAIAFMPRATKHYVSFAYRRIPQILTYSTMAITLVPTIEHTKSAIVNSPTIGNVNVIFNQLRALHVIAYTDYRYIIEHNDTNVRDPYMILYHVPGKQPGHRMHVRNT